MLSVWKVWPRYETETETIEYIFCNYEKLEQYCGFILDTATVDRRRIIQLIKTALKQMDCCDL